MSRKKIIGRIEKVDFPDWNIFGIDAKIDTGAYTSSLHCHEIDLDSEKRNVTFSVFDPSHPEFEHKRFISPVHDIRSIRSSNGLAEDRIIIKTTLSIIGEEYPTELSLTNRSEMRYPVLLGRKFIKGRFIVDVSKKFIGREA
jgi:hypothetical protein